MGKVMDEISWKKQRISGPYRLANYVEEMTGGGASGPSFSAYYYGKRQPRPDTICRFAEAFNCTEEEKIELAYVSIYGERRKSPRI